MEEAAKTAKQSAESVSKGGEKLGRTAAFRALSQVSWMSGPILELRARVPTLELNPKDSWLHWGGECSGTDWWGGPT